MSNAFEKLTKYAAARFKEYPEPLPLTFREARLIVDVLGDELARASADFTSWRERFEKLDGMKHKD